MGRSMSTCRVRFLEGEYCYAFRKIRSFGCWHVLVWEKARRHLVREQQKSKWGGTYGRLKTRWRPAQWRILISYRTESALLEEWPDLDRNRELEGS